ncbi:hypothetical protein OE88DRAFT_1652133 [Heliocybe sulcata]|uniref:Uncharacterized protein n=1 Tax=Heliocybe sulcata TaxID=5364 RepID=A0A5C3NEA6_9AGAM|nr:hypothetical protein OE88DRAFT_1652133 [Heliocybe sulcata]
MDSASIASFDTASTLSVASTATMVPPKKPAVKDYAAAFGALQSTYGTSTYIPTPTHVPSQSKSPKSSSSSSLSKLFKRSKSSETKPSEKASSDSSSKSASKKPSSKPRDLHVDPK